MKYKTTLFVVSFLIMSGPTFAARHPQNIEKKYVSESFSGKASFYHEPQPLASGGRFDPNGITAAHRTLPLGSKVRVTNKRNGKSVTVTINDRGPAAWTGKIIDLSLGAAQEIGLSFKQGWTDITADVLSYGGKKKKS